MSSLFTGLSAFPLTPADAAGIVDTEALGRLADRLAAARVDSIGLLGSTGTYAYLDRPERGRAVAAAVEAAAGRVPIIVGVGALRTSWAIELAREAERLGADGLLMAPISYTPLSPGEVAAHYRAVAVATGLPLAIYNNPGTTNFLFSDDLIADLAAVPGIAAIKMPLPADGDPAAELARLRARTPADFRIGYSGDWGAAPSLLAGGDAFFSVIGGVMPQPMLALVRAGQAGDVSRTRAIDAAFAPLWALFRRWGSLRIMFEIADQVGLRVGEPPLPLRRAEVDIGGRRRGSARGVGTDLEALPPEGVGGAAERGVAIGIVEGGGTQQFAMEFGRRIVVGPEADAGIGTLAQFADQRFRIGTIAVDRDIAFQAIGEQTGRDRRITAEQLIGTVAGPIVIGVPKPAHDATESNKNATSTMPSQTCGGGDRVQKPCG